MEDVVVQFPDYDTFSRLVDSPSPRAISEGAMNGDFEILESKLVELGGNVKCDSMFKAKYCSALESMSTPEQLIEGDLSCCLDELTSSQKKLLQEHLDDSGFEDESGALEESAGGMMGLSMNMIIFGIAGIGILFMIVAGAVMLKGGKKPSKAATPSATPSAGAAPGIPQAMPGENPQITELKNYVQQVLTQGYTWDQVRTHLLEIGWDAGTADSVIRDAQQRIAGVQQARQSAPSQQAFSQQAQPSRQGRPPAQ